MTRLRISERTIEHVLKRHRDWVEMLGLRSREEIKRFLLRVISRPDEVHEDRVRRDVKYLLLKLNGKFLCVVVVGDDVVTAYLINQAKYLKYKVRRWV